MTTYTISYDHASAGYGQPVLLDDAGEPHGAADVGLWGLPENFCGQVYVKGSDAQTLRDRTFWSGYGASPDKMWQALCRASRAYPTATIAEVRDAGMVHLREPADDQR